MPATGAYRCSTGWQVHMYGRLEDGSFTSDVALDAAGNLYLAKPWSDKQIVRQYDSNLNLVRTFRTPGVAY